MDQPQVPTVAAEHSYDALFAALPPLTSPEYLQLLETASSAALPAPVLARSYRQLAAAGADAAARATLERLIGSPHREIYLMAVRNLARKRVPLRQYSEDAEDLFQATLGEIIEALPTQRGDFAETNWVTFCKHCFEDCWRKLFGRDGVRVKRQRVEAELDIETGKERDPLDMPDHSFDWHIALRETQLPWLEAFVQRTVADFKDPLMRKVAEDQFGPDPSPISADRSKSGRQPLTEQLGVHRSRITRARDYARDKIFVALMRQKEHELDLDWLRELYQDK